MAKIDWEKARVDYVSSDVTLREIAVMYSCSPRIVQKRSAEGAWPRQREEFRAKVARRIELKQVDAEVDRNTQHLLAFDKTLELLKEQLSKPLTVRQLLEASRALKLIQDGQRIALGLDSDKSKQEAQDAAQKLIDELNRSIHQQTDTSAESSAEEMEPAGWSGEVGEDAS